MREHRVLRAGWLPAAMIFLFITAFDPWPTEARAEDAARCPERVIQIGTAPSLAPRAS